MIEPKARPSLLIRGNDVRYGDVVSAAANGKDWKYIDFRVLRMRAGEVFGGESAGNEVAVVVIAGTVDVLCSDGSWKNVGKRADPFSGSPEAVYLPPATAYELKAVSDVEVAICAAPARERHPGRLIALGADAEHVRGTGQAKRRVFNILMDEDGASSLFLTEVVTFAGHWSSYPPHKHDTDDPPFESQLEELYYYRAQPAAGFAFHRVYTADGDIDETLTVHDTDVVLVPRGYHVCAAAAEYQIYYLNVLAGPKHVYHMTFDPAHAWIKENWTW